MTQRNDDGLYLLGIDIGGTELAVGMIGFDGRLLSSERTPTEVQGKPEGRLAQLEMLPRRAVEVSGLEWPQVAAVGIGCGGPLDPARGMVPDPLCLSG